MPMPTLLNTLSMNWRVRGIVPGKKRTRICYLTNPKIGGLVVVGVEDCQLHFFVSVFAPECDSSAVVGFAFDDLLGTFDVHLHFVTTSHSTCQLSDAASMVSCGTPSVSMYSIWTVDSVILCV